jgi:hypothetical protein
LATNRFLRDFTQNVPNRRVGQRNYKTLNKRKITKAND